jgi:hypothetical protein
VAEADWFRLLVALPPVRDLLLCAKHLFVAAKTRRVFQLLLTGFSPPRINQPAQYAHGRVVVESECPAEPVLGILLIKSAS